MTHRILDVQQRLKPLLQDMHGRRSRFWPAGQLKPIDWITFARIYAHAATALNDPGKVHALPQAQLAGHAIECALKAYLTHKAVRFSTGTKGHDLVTLCTLAETHGCLVEELEAVAIYQISLLYFEDDGSTERYAGRYPNGGGQVPKSYVGFVGATETFVSSVAAQCGA